jgi:DNA-binding transcriptional LysR family regulator
MIGMNVAAVHNNLRFPLYAYYPSRRQAPAKLRAFLEFIHLIAANA